ncbi:MAG: hypothetical protein WEB19_02970 [Acidimicrobiia bacterium]
MATDQFVAPELDDLPRQLPNLAPGVNLPPAREWRADRPGDLEAGQPTGLLLGRPGPNIGYAFTLAERVRDQLKLASHESADDAIAVISELAMKRAASFGRAPVIRDVEVAGTLLGYLRDAGPEFVEWRVHALHGAEHEYGVRRAIVDAVPDAVLRMPPQVPALLDECRSELKAALDH